MVKDLFIASGIPFRQDLIDRFEVLLGAYERWQSRLNFTAVKDRKTFILKMFVGSIWPLYRLECKGEKRVLDVGTGGGFPGLPIALCRNDFRVFLNDSVKKKLEMIADIRALLSINNIEMIHERIEVLGQNSEYRESFDLVTARALAIWPIVLEYSLPLVAVGGQFWAYQGPAIYEYLEDKRVLEILGGEIEAVETFSLPYEMGERVLVVVRKIKETPAKYPRSVGVPVKHSL